MTLKVIFSEVSILYDKKESEDEEKMTLKMIINDKGHILSVINTIWWGRGWRKNYLKKMTMKVIFSEVSILYDEKEDEEKITFKKWP